MVAPARIWKPTLDVNDLAAAKTFWLWLLGTDVCLDFGDEGVHLGPSDGPAVLCLQHVSEPRPGKNRMHLDVMANGDLDELRAEVLRRGGDEVAGPNSVGDFRWYVLTDPDGNEFCLSTPFPGA